MNRPDIDTIEQFFPIAFENSTTISKMGIDSVLGLVKWAKAQEARIEALQGRHMVAPMAVAAGLNADATLDELYEHLGKIRGDAARVAELETGATWRRIDGPGIDGQRVMLRELDPFDKYNRGDENRDAIASGYWSDEYRYFVWPFGCTDHPPTHWAPMPDRLLDQRGEGESDEID